MGSIITYKYLLDIRFHAPLDFLKQCLFYGIFYKKIKK